MRLVAAALVVGLLLASAPVLADPEPAAPAGEADLIRRGVAAREQGQDQLAYNLFKERFERYKSPRAEAQLGLAAQALGRWAEADEHVRAALGAANDGWIASNKKALEQALSVIEQHVGTLEVLGNVAGAEVLVDGRPLGRLPLVAPIRLSVGTAVVEMRAEGYAPLQRSVSVLPGQLTRETFDLVTIQKAAPRLEASSPTVPPPPFVATTSTPEPAPGTTPLSST
jgi:tetratricopeptide (TPR) repeat protein